MVYRSFQISFEFRLIYDEICRWLSTGSLSLLNWQGVDASPCSTGTTKLNFPISPVLLMMCSEFQALHIIDLHLIFFHVYQDLLLQLSIFSQVAVMWFHSEEHTLNLTPYAPSWLSNSTSNLLETQSQIKLVTNIVVNTIVVDYNSAHKNPYPW